MAQGLRADNTHWEVPKRVDTSATVGTHVVVRSDDDTCFFSFPHSDYDEEADYNGVHFTTYRSDSEDIYKGINPSVDV